MFELTVKTHFSSAHCLRGYDGKCVHLHGHNWKVSVSVQGKDTDENGLLVDFKILREKIEDFLDTLDHKNLNDIPPFDTINPSSENLSKFIFHKLKEELAGLPVKVSKVTIDETENVECSYWED